jgi:small basic protein (TIGR04137 family)
MSIDRTLRLKSSLERHRNVLDRAERIAALQAQERWTPETGALGLPKVGHRKVKAAKKKAVKAEDATAEGAAPAPGTTPPAAS